jgi:hypothetical protein
VEAPVIEPRTSGSVARKFIGIKKLLLIRLFIENARKSIGFCVLNIPPIVTLVIYILLLFSFDIISDRKPRVWLGAPASRFSSAQLLSASHNTSVLAMIIIAYKN